VRDERRTDGGHVGVAQRLRVHLHLARVRGHRGQVEGRVEEEQLVFGQVRRVHDQSPLTVDVRQLRDNLAIDVTITCIDQAVAELVIRPARVDAADEGRARDRSEGGEREAG
jgi:hypothetical protein